VLKNGKVSLMDFGRPGIIRTVLALSTESILRSRTLHMGEACTGTTKAPSV